MPEAQTGTWRNFELFVPLSKAERDPHTGAIRVEGIATDESVDLDREVVKSAGLADSLEYLGKFGKFNWDHGPGIIGDIEQSAFLGKAEARARYGTEITGRALEVAGVIHPIPDPAIAPEGLKQAHHLLSVGSPMGFSIQGKIHRKGREKSLSGDEVGTVEQAFVNMVALTPQPKNLHTTCRLAKSLSEAVEAAQDSADDTGETGIPILIMAKAMASGYGTDHGSFTGVRALTKESLEGAPQTQAGPDMAADTPPKKKRRRKRKAVVLKALAALTELQQRRRNAEILSEVLTKALPKLGTGTRFKNLLRKLRRKGVRNPRALAATIGRRRWGAKRMARWSSQGRRRAHH